MKQLLCLCLFLVIEGVNGYSQATVTSSNNSGDKSNTSQDPASIYNVSLYTGTASVSIPIYDYSIGNLDLGVSLNYDTRGIKVDQTAEPTGLGWDLSAGGYIVRSVNGMEDEGYMPRIDTTDGQTTWAKQMERRGNLVSAAADNINGHPTVHDKEYDVFEAHFGGRTVKFIIGTCYTDKNASTACNCGTGAGFGPRLIATYPKSEINIEIGGLVTRSGGDVDYTNVPYPENAALTFKITDEKGNVYYFDRGDYEKRLIAIPHGVISYTYFASNKWVLKRITTEKGQSIVYTYNTWNDVSYHAYRDEQVYESVDHNEGYGQNVTFVGNKIEKRADSTVSWTGNITTISTITYPNGTVVSFNYDPNQRCDVPGAHALKSITIQSGYDNQVKNSITYNFNYAYFHSPIQPVGGLPGNQNTELSYAASCNDLQQSFGTIPPIAIVHLQRGLRLKLKSIDKVGTDNTTTERYYTFDYNTTPLPERLSPGKDYYGYYNGKNPVFSYSPSNMSNPPSLSYSSIPLHTFSFSNGETFTYGTDRTPDVSYMQACNLTKVTNQLGGTAEFYYQDHNLYNPANAYGNGPNFLLPTNYDGPNANDGLCISKIIKKDGFNIDNTQTLEYTFSKGQRFYRGGFFWDPQYFDYGSTGNQNDINALLTRSKIYYNSMISPRSYLNGSNHGYSYVTVTNKGYNNQVQGSTKYHFTNLMDESDTTISNLKLRIFGCQNCGYGPDMLGNPFHPDYFNEYKMGLVLDVSNYDMNGDLIAKTTNTYADNADIPFSYMNTRIIGQSNSSANQPFNHDSYLPFTSKKSLLQSTTNSSYVNGNAMSSVQNYTYDINDNVTNVTWTDSKGLPCEKKFYYKGQNVERTELWKNSKQISMSGIYLYSANSSYFNTTYSLKSETPIDANSSSNSYTVSDDKEYTYDDHYNVIQTDFDANKTSSSSIWDTRFGQKIADVQNAQFADIAYTSFEGTYQPKGTFDYNKGNWDFDPNSIVNDPGTAMTGHYYYNLNPSNGNSVNGINKLANNQQYLLSFWSWGVAQVYLGSQLLPTTTVISGGVNGLWKLINVVVQGNGNDKLTISSPVGSKIDELRLCPTTASMTTTTFEPLFGPNAVINERNNIVYYEYDVFGRKVAVRDIYKHIISYTKQINQGLDN